MLDLITCRVINRSLVMFIVGDGMRLSYILQFEGTPFYPDAGRFWQIVEKYKVTKFYTAPTAIRSLMKYGESYVKKYVFG